MIWVTRPTAEQLDRLMRYGATAEDINRAHWNVWSMPGTDPARRVTRVLLGCLAARRGIARAA